MTKKKEKEKILFPEQQQAFDVLMTGKNVFLSGEAGTGKSTVLNKFRKEVSKLGKKVVVVAPTGIAAINVSGSTIHRTFKAPANPLLENPRSIPPDLYEADVFIIEEVSMCRVDLFDWMSYCIFSIAKKKKESGKPLIQVVTCGDFFQLPPVILPKERSVLETKYPNIGKGFAFQSIYWDKYCFQHICLTQVIRQKDIDFVNVLNQARVGDMSCLYYLESESKDSEISDAIYLSGRNSEVSEINNRKLCEIHEETYVFHSNVTGDVKFSDKVTEDVLYLKKGARVMTLINDSDDMYRNGSFGTVVKCSSMYDKQRVVVKIDNGPEVAIEPFTWEIADYSVISGKFERVVVGTFTQIPLKLAYAVTIHKSQGQTYDKVNLNPECWDVGQLYVALSRVRSIEGLYLTKRIEPRFLTASDMVKLFYMKHHMSF